MRAITKRTIGDMSVGFAIGSGLIMVLMALALPDKYQTAGTFPETVITFNDPGIASSVIWLPLTRQTVNGAQFEMGLRIDGVVVWRQTL